MLRAGLLTIESLRGKGAYSQVCPGQASFIPDNWGNQGRARVRQERHLTFKDVPTLWVMQMHCLEGERLLKFCILGTSLVSA